MLPTIENPNSCGQGYCAAHAENPHHETLTAAGWTYSHTTPIGRPDGSKFLRHTYRCSIDPEWSAGVSMTPGNPVDVHRGGSGHHTTFFAHSLRRYLKRKNAELRRLVRAS